MTDQLPDQGHIWFDPDTETLKVRVTDDDDWAEVVGLTPTLSDVLAESSGAGGAANVLDFDPDGLARIDLSMTAPIADQASGTGAKYLWNVVNDVVGTDIAVDEVTSKVNIVVDGIYAVSAYGEADFAVGGEEALFDLSATLGMALVVEQQVSVDSTDQFALGSLSFTRFLEAGTFIEVTWNCTTSSGTWSIPASPSSLIIQRLDHTDQLNAITAALIAAGLMDAPA